LVIDQNARCDRNFDVQGVIPRWNGQKEIRQANLRAEKLSQVKGLTRSEQGLATDSKAGPGKKRGTAPLSHQEAACRCTPEQKKKKKKNAVSSSLWTPPRRPPGVLTSSAQKGRPWPPNREKTKHFCLASFSQYVHSPQTFSQPFYGPVERGTPPRYKKENVTRHQTFRHLKSNVVPPFRARPQDLRKLAPEKPPAADKANSGLAEKLLRGDCRSPCQRDPY